MLANPDNRHVQKSSRSLSHRLRMVAFCSLMPMSPRVLFTHAKGARGSFIERQNWTVRTTMRHYTRLSNGFSRKIENHMAAVALNYFAYNFIKIHRTLRVTPAMASGVIARLWEVSDLVALLVESEKKAA